MTDIDAPVLIAQTGPLRGQRWNLDQEKLEVGRGATCAIRIDDKTVSRRHAIIFREGDAWIVEDASKNGTYVNDAPVTDKTVLADGDVIAVATAVKLVFVGSEATVPLTIEPPAHGQLKIDVAARRVWIGGVEIDPPLSLPQYRLLELLYTNSGQVCTRDAVVDAVWPEAQGAGVSEQSIDALVRRLRDRISEFDPAHQYVVTVRGHGFRLDNPS
ncbi:MAG: FHA domain-containing protein [Anaerolineales bacterium]